MTGTPSEPSTDEHLPASKEGLMAKESGLHRQSQSAGELGRLSEEETALRTAVGETALRTAVGSKRKRESAFVVGRVKIALSSYVCPPRAPTEVQ
jgi:hypothetical protein